MEIERSTPVLEPEIHEEKKTKRQPPYNVVLLDDDDHTYEYVIQMLAVLFGFGRPKAYLLAREVDWSGRVIVLTTSKEHAELKQEQIHSFGADPVLSHSAGSMTAVLEPVESD